MRINASTITFLVALAASSFAPKHGCPMKGVSAFTMSNMKFDKLSFIQSGNNLERATVALSSSTLDATENEKKTTPAKVNNKKSNKKRSTKKKFDKSKSLLSSNKSMNGKTKKPSVRADFKENLPLSSLELGSKISGVVAGVSPFGAFVRTSYALKPGSVGGYALLHKSQIQDDIVEDINEVLKVGQRLDNLRVISINYAKGEVNLSLRTPRPARKELSEIAVGDMLRGKVRNLTPYGAFVDVGCKVNLLVHKSRISTLKVDNISDFVKTGDMVNVRVIDKDEKNNNLAGSMLRLDADLYLTKRQKQLEKKNALNAARRSYKVDEFIHKTESEIFDEAMDGLSDAVN